MESSTNETGVVVVEMGTDGDRLEPAVSVAPVKSSTPRTPPTVAVPSLSPTDGSSSAGTETWCSDTLPPCHVESAVPSNVAGGNVVPSRLWGIYHLITFKGMLSSYVVGTTALGYYMAPGKFDLKQFGWTCGGTALTVLSANAWNQIFEGKLGVIASCKPVIRLKNIVFSV